MDVFVKFPNPVFVETGTYIGDGVQMALDAGFPTIYSLELAEYYYRSSQKRFQEDSRVHIVLGNSSYVLYNVIKNIQQPITFWLDGHYSGGLTAKTHKNTPVLDELDQIKKHHIKTHTILIDDMRCCDTWWFDNISKKTIIEKIYEINPDYTITYEDGAIAGDVLVAQVLPKK
jgi:hypothetical protein